MLDEIAFRLLESGSGLLPYAVTVAAVLFVVVGVSGLLGGRDPVEERLARGTSRAGGGEGVSLRRDASGMRLKRLAPFLTPSDARERSAVRDRLIRAGYRSEAATRIYFLARAILGLGAGTVIAVLLPLLGSNVDPVEILIFTGGGALLGYVLPNYWVLRRTQHREEQIRDGFPDALDMLLICVEAGQALDMALARVAVEIGGAHPVLAEELAIVGQQLRAGKERAEVLRDFSRRTGIDDIGAFVTVLIQSDQFGTSIGDALRVYASEMRQKRLMRAEEKANKLPVKLALGTMAFVVPPVLLILIGPSIIMVMRAFVQYFG